MNIAVVIFFVAIALLLIYAGITTLKNGNIKFFGKQFTGASARVIGVIVILVGLIPLAIAIVYATAI